MSIRAINWARHVGKTTGMPPGHRLVLMTLCCFHNDKTGECFPSYDTVSDEVGYRRRKIVDMVEDLQFNGLLIKQKRRVGGHQGSNHHVLFGRPAFEKWRTRVSDTAPCKSARISTLTRVPPGAHDKEELYKDTGSAGFSVITGGRASA